MCLGVLFVLLSILSICFSTSVFHNQPWLFSNFHLLYYVAEFVCHIPQPSFSCEAMGSELHLHFSGDSVGNVRDLMLCVFMCVEEPTTLLLSSANLAALAWFLTTKNRCSEKREIKKININVRQKLDMLKKSIAEQACCFLPNYMFH